MALLKGILIGMSTAFILGPVFFTLLRNSLQKGITAGILTALGIVFSDVVVAFLCYTFAGNFINNYVELPIVKFVAASILLFFAYSFYTKPVQDLKKQSITIKSKGHFKSFAQGFIVNFANPAVFLLWVAFITLAQSQYTLEHDVHIYLLGILIGVFVTDSAKALGAASLSPYLKSEWLVIIFKVLAIILIGVALYLIYEGFA